MKTYLRKHVAHEIYMVLTHFKTLQPMMDKYGKKGNNNSKRITAIIHPVENVYKYSKCHFLNFCTVYNDGTTKVLMCLSGTIPVMFKGKDFYIACYQ